MEIRKELITPEKAAEYLSLVDAKMQRPAQPTYIVDLTNLMKNGDFMETGQTIQISRTNRLLDGQHRLHAIVRSGKSYNMIVVRDVPDETFVALDRGKIRSVSDMIHMSGLDRPKLRGQLARMVIAFRADKPGGLTSGFVVRSQLVIPSKLIAFNKENNLTPHLDFADKTAHANGSSFLTKGEWAFLSFILSERNQIEAGQFLSNLAVGAGLKQDSPILSARNKLINLMNKKRLLTTYVEKMSVVIRAWNHFRTGKTPNRINLIDNKSIPKPL